jgi:hypothetical protein
MPPDPCADVGAKDFSPVQDSLFQGLKHLPSMLANDLGEFGEESLALAAQFLGRRGRALGTTSFHRANPFDLPTGGRCDFRILLQA